MCRLNGFLEVRLNARIVQVPKFTDFYDSVIVKPP